MKKIFRVILVLMVATAILIGTNNTSKISVFADQKDIIKDATSAIAIEVESGQILFEYNAHSKLAPASMTKIVTMKLVLDALAQKRIDEEQLVTTSPHAASMGGTQIYLSVGEQMKVKDLFKSMVIASANDAAVALAEAVSGTEEHFVTMMNNEAKKLGLTNTNYVNVSGLPEKNHYTTSHDMAMMARELLKNYEDQIIPITSTYEDYVRTDTDKPFWLVNTNKLIKHAEGVDGLKTGWTAEAGYCLTCTKKVDGMRIITVVMNASSVEKRSQDTLALMNYIFATYEKQVLVPKGSVIKVEENILLDPSTYNIVTTDAIIKVVPKGTVLTEIEKKVEIDHNAISALHTTNIGKYQIYSNGSLIGETNLELKEVITKASFWELLVEIFKRIF